MLDYLVIGVVAAAAVALALLHRFSARVQSFDALVKFVLTLGAAFIVVSLVPHFNGPPPEPAAEVTDDQSLSETDSEEPTSEKARLKELATAAAAEVAEEIRNAHNLAARARAAGSDAAGNAVIDDGEMTPSAAVGQLLEDPALPDHGTTGGQSAMISFLRSLEGISDVANDRRRSFNSRVTAVDRQADYLGELEELLLVEADYLGGEINDEEARLRSETLVGIDTVTDAESGASLQVGPLNVTPALVEEGEALAVSAWVTNPGDSDAVAELTLAVDGVASDPKQVQLAPGESREVLLDSAVFPAGDHVASVGDLSRNFTVGVPATMEIPPLGIEQLSITPETPAVGETITVEVIAVNLATVEVTDSLVLKLDGVQREVREITLAAGSTETVVLTISVNGSGTHTLSVNGVNRRLTVVKDGGSVSEINWWFVGGIAIGVILIGALTTVISLRRRSQ